MKIEANHVQGVLIAHLKIDSLETGNVAEFRSAVTPLVERNDRVVFDLSEVGFMDSTGLGAMLSCLRSLKARGGSLKLASLTPEVVQLFEMVMMDRVFEVFPTADDAVASFR